MAQPPFHFRAGGLPHPSTQLHNGNPHHVNMHQQDQAMPTQPLPTQQMGLPADMDMSVLEGISPEQLAAIARMFQAGALRMPPPLPNPPTHAQPVLSTGQPPASHLASQQPDSARSNLNVDAEEGEVVESGEEHTPAHQRDFLRPPPTGPRNRSASPRGRKASLKQQKTSKAPAPSQSTSMKKTAVAQLVKSEQKNSRVSGGSRGSKEEGAKLFVLELVTAGYSYEDLLPEVGNPKVLDRMFRKLNLPIPAQRPLAQVPRTNGAAVITAPADTSLSLPSVNEDTRKPSVTKRPLPTKAAPIDRNEYLAKLQAAKKKKAESMATSTFPPSEPVAEKPVTPPTQSTSIDPPSSDGGISMGAPQLASKSASMTELARKKLEAFKALQAAKLRQNAASSPLASTVIQNAAQRQSNSSPPRTGLGAGIAEIAPQIAQTLAQPLLSQPAAPLQHSVSPMLETPSRPFSGLPGLFKVGGTTTTSSTSAFPPPATYQAETPTRVEPAAPLPQQLSSISNKSQALFGTPTASPGPLTVPRKRPVASDFDDFSYKPSIPKKPFGQSRNGSEEDSLIIQASDEEDEDDDDMEIDPPSPKPTLLTRSFREVGPLRDFPPKATFATPASAARTPDGITYEQKMREIEEFKKRIAERESRQKVNGHATPTKSFDVSVSAPVTVPSTPRTEVPTPGGASDFILPNSTVTKQELKEKLRKRLLELEQASLRRSQQQVEAPVVADLEPEMVAEPELDLTMSGALPTEAMSSEGLAEAAESLPRTTQEVAEAEQNPDLEEGELDDDDSSNFYEVEERPTEGIQLAAAEPVSISGNNGEIGSQVTTVSATTASHAIPEIQEEAETADLDYDPMEDVEDLEDTAASQLGLPTPLESLPGSSVGSLADADTEEAEDEDEVDVAEPWNVQDEQDEGSSPASSDEDEDGEIVDDDDDDGDEDSDANNMDLDLEMQESAEMQIDPESSAASSSDEDNDSDDDDVQIVPQPRPPQQSISDTRPTAIITDEPSIADNLAPELQPPIASQTATSTQHSAEPSRFFKPYHSPLAAFKDFRYHPEYLSTVPGGHKSATYSHNIDAQNALCPFETAGGKCTDAGCAFQHWRDVGGVSDNELLQRMVARDMPARTPEERKRWNEGIGSLIREMRAMNSRPPAVEIAARIAEFRRAFRADPSKVLWLDGDVDSA